MRPKLQSFPAPEGAFLDHDAVLRQLDAELFPAPSPSRPRISYTNRPRLRDAVIETGVSAAKCEREGIRLGSLNLWPRTFCDQAGLKSLEVA